MNHHIVSVLVASAGFVISSDADAQGEGRRLALVIGVSAYDALGGLDRAVEDAKAVAGVLQDKAKFSVTAIMDPTSAELREGVASFAASVQRNDVVVIYYAGHGVQAGGRNYLLGGDFPNEARRLDAMGLQVDALLDMVSVERPLIKLLILDACRNSPLKGVSEAGLARMEADTTGGGTRIEFAASAGQVARDGLFARHLVAQIARPGLDVDAVFRNVRGLVGKQSQGQQITSSESKLTVNFYFIPAQMASPGEALAVLERVAAAMPRRELGQTAALQALVQQEQSLAGTKLLEGLSLEGGTFNGADLERALLAGTDFDAAALRNARLTRADFAFATLEGADLSSAIADSAAFALVRADSAVFDGLQASGSTWFAARARRGRFSGATLDGAGFMFADLRNAVFDRADLKGAIFLGSDLRGASFKGATLANTDFTGSLLDPGALTSVQAREACQLDVPVVPSGMYGHVLNVVIIEAIPSNQFQGGYENARFSGTQHLFRLPSNRLGPCKSRVVSRSRWFPIWQNRGEDHVQTDISHRLSHKFLEQAGRRGEVRSRIDEHLESAYPFPAATYTTSIAEADVTAESRALAGGWSMEFAADGRLLLNRVGQPPIVLRYEKQPLYRFIVKGDDRRLGCGAAIAEYRWFLTAEGNLKLMSYPEDACSARARVLQSRDWVPRLAAR